MFIHQMTIRPRYGEVDQMGYVYHANYISYCHQARTEMLRSLGICDKELDDRGILLPVISMRLMYHKPAGYDDLLTIKTKFKKHPGVRMTFLFTVFRGEEKICSAESEIVIADKRTRKPVRIPDFINDAFTALKNHP